MTVDEHGIRLQVVPDEVVDVHFDGHRVFSTAPAGLAVPLDSSGACVPWPKVLTPRLNGRARLVVKGHLSGTVLVDEPIQLGDSDEPIWMGDARGRPLTVDKFGALVRMFADTDESTAQHLASEVARLVRDVNDFGVHGFLAYGSLLGAVRNGHLIGHDTDTDTAYLSNFTDPADIARESYALERFLLDRGWGMARMRVGLIRAIFDDRDGDKRHIDIFIAVHDGRELFLDPFVSSQLPVSAVVPLSTVVLEGVEVLAPADPDAVLAATYGPSYLVPDPSFAYDSPPWLERKSFAWMGDFRRFRSPWHRRFRAHWREKGRPKASAFARSVAAKEGQGATIVEVGCGMGSDTLWLAKQGHRVIALDYADPPMRWLRRIAKTRGLPAEFHRMSLYDVQTCLAYGAWLVDQSDGQIAVYSRHVLDVLEVEGRTNFWLLCRAALLRGGRLHLRFRTRTGKASADEPGFRALDPNLIESEALARGARLLERVDGPRATEMVLAWA